MKPSRSMPLNGQILAATSPPASKNIPKPSKLRVTNGGASAEPPQGERARYGSPQAEVGPPRGANPNRSESQNVDLPSSAQTPVGQHIHPPPPPKDLPTSGWSLTPPAPGVTKISSRRTQDTTPGGRQALTERPLPGVPAFPDESRKTAPRDMKGSHDPLNRQPAPNDVSSPPVRRQQKLLLDANYYLNHLPRLVTLTIPYRSQITP